MPAARLRVLEHPCLRRERSVWRSSLGTSIVYYIDDTISICNIHILATVFLLSFYMDDNRQRCYNYVKMEEVYAYVNQ